MTFEDVEITEPDPGTPDPDDAERSGRRRRHLVVGLVVAVPVLAAGALLGTRALSGSDVDLEPVVQRLSERTSALLEAGGPGTAGYASAGRGTPERGLEGGGSGPDVAGAVDVTVLCASVRAQPAELTVRSGGEVVGRLTAECSDAADAGADPAVTVLPDVVLGRGFRYEVVPRSPAALGVVVR